MTNLAQTKLSGNKPNAQYEASKYDILKGSNGTSLPKLLMHEGH